MLTSFQDLHGPVCYFEFPNRENKIQPVCFSNPHEVVIARTPEQILPSLERIQQAMKEGYYAAGYMAYEASFAFHSQIKISQIQPTVEPLLWFGLFTEPGDLPTHRKTSFAITDWQPKIPFDTYSKNFDKVMQYIHDHKTNQVNYTIRLGAHFVGDDFAYFRQLTQSQLANYTCYLKTDERRILSASPELFFKIQDGKMITRPMAGTAKRGKTKAEDEASYAWLQQSDKNKLENKLTVELLKHDLNKVSKHGSVTATSLFDIETYPTVYQMTSTVEGELREDASIIDIFRALFPSGSITGNPKGQTMDIIAEVESSPRGVYCGAIGFISPDGNMTFNVPIRTVVIQEDTGEAEYGVGGGITINSNVNEEYEEILTKAAVLEQNKQDFQLLESLRLEKGTYFLIDNHMNRLLQSADYFNYQVSRDTIENSLLNYAKKNKENTMKVRLLVSHHGDVSVEGEVISPITEVKKVTVARKSIQKHEIFLRHKTTNRDLYDRFKSEHPTLFDVLLWNEHGEITEFTMGNIVVEMDGNYYTPKLDSGLLPGTYREYLLARGEIEEKRLTIQDLEMCSKVWFINSVRKWVEVEF
ncbi:chorismate-binding protein [Virgibacillus soli]|uniref:chorismate-binding protein n=1 Tax=Paracerasibacillus soli TaxID=480284 RepID=UPI0035ED06C9